MFVRALGIEAAQAPSAQGPISASGYLLVNAEAGQQRPFFLTGASIGQTAEFLKFGTGKKRVEINELLK